MDTDSGAKNPTNSNYVVKNHFPFIWNLEKSHFSNREMDSNTGTGEFYSVLGPVFF